ncbi:MAG: hypothetical protein R3C24_05325 [Cyanobacteriota/Melainabacteria group bacterium]
MLTLALTGGHAPAHSQASTTAKSINKAAQDCVGKEMWKKGYGLKSGGLGCAASVSNVLNKAGIAYVRTPVTLYMRLPNLCKASSKSKSSSSKWRERRHR